MGERFFVMINATDLFEKDFLDFRSYTDPSPVVEKMHDWLEKKCSMDCVPAAEEEALRAQNGGVLPEQTFLCPEIEKPVDLEKYNGFYEIEGMGNCVYNMFLTVVHDVPTAERFRTGFIKEYEVGAVFTPQADHIRRMLDVFVASFSDDTIDITEAEETLRNFIIAGGFDPFAGSLFATDYTVFTGDDD